MNKRLLKARRILAGQIAIERLAVWRLIDLHRQEDLLEERRLALVRFIDGEAAFAGLFAGATMRRLDALEATRAAIRKEQEAEAGLRLAEGARRRLAAAVVKSLQSEARRRTERFQLAEAIDASLHRSAQGSDKFDPSS